MTNQEAIRMLIRLKDRLNWEVTDAQKKMDALNMAIKALEQEPKWIPVSERLPEDDEEVIVSCTDDSGDSEFTYTTVGWHYKGLWVVNNERCFYVVAWMPIPQPYKAEIEDNA